MCPPSPSFVSPTRPSPQFGEELDSVGPCQATLDLLLRRRSILAKNMTEPGPTPAQIEMMLTAASRVPDHGKLSPWRFILFQNEARAAFGNTLAQIWQGDNPTAREGIITMERERFLRAPLIVGVIAQDIAHKKIPLWEQNLSVGAVCQLLLLAAHATGFVGQWLTEWYASHPKVDAVLGLKDNERMAGFIYMGSTDTRPQERKRPIISEKIEYWNAS